MYLISHQLCSKSTNHDAKLRPSRLCASVLPDLAIETGVTVPRTSLPDVFNYSHGSDAFVLTGLGSGSGTRSAETKFDQLKSNDNLGFGQKERAKPTLVKVPAKRAVSISLRHNAIPGSLLVTILALVGIVAVARRDVSSQDNHPVAASGLKVARITSSRHNSDIVASHLQ